MVGLFLVQIKYYVRSEVNRLAAFILRASSISDAANHRGCIYPHLLSIHIDILARAFCICGEWIARPKPERGGKHIGGGRWAVWGLVSVALFAFRVCI